jgi:hypothetical protein
MGGALGGAEGIEAIQAEGGDTMEGMMNDSEVAAAKRRMQSASEFSRKYYQEINSKLDSMGPELKSAFEEFTNVIGKDAQRSSSLGRSAIPYKDSQFTAAYKKLMTKACSGTPDPVLIKSITNLRASVARQCLHQQEFIFQSCKDTLDNEWFTNTQRQMDFARHSFNETVGMDGLAEDGVTFDASKVGHIRDLDEAMSGFGRGRMTRGAVLKRFSNRLDSDSWPCMVSAGLYSRYLCEGERAANRYLEAVTFVAGQRRSTPKRRSSASLHSTEFYRTESELALYGGVGPGVCLTPDGTGWYTVTDMNAMDVAAGRSWLAKFNTDAEKTEMLNNSKAWQVAQLMRNVGEGKVDPTLLGIGRPGDWEFRGPRGRDGKPIEVNGKEVGPKKWCRKYTEPLDAPNDPRNSPTVRSERICGGDSIECCNAEIAGPNGEPLDIDWSPEIRANGSPSDEIQDAVQELIRGVRTKASPWWDKFGWRRRWRVEAAKNDPMNVLRRIEMETVDDIGTGESASARGRGWNRQWYVTTLGQLLKWGSYVFMFFLLFNQMAHDKTGCYLQQLHAGEAEEPYWAIKLCPDATFPHGAFSASANGAIRYACSCDCWYGRSGTCKPETAPTNLMAHGCTAGVSMARVCRKDEKSAGFNYEWNDYSVWQAITDTATSMTQDLGSCIECATKLGAMALGGGITSVFAIVAILIILYVVHWVYRNFFSSMEAGGASNAPSINISS